ncbi:hypothetical protein SXCC_02711 [Gluconacetobacter sp. SXCC-1]|nr:hypothetical protein SXCC_02711 [Gluconacetobacter sp. SXCC-1]
MQSFINVFSIYTVIVNIKLKYINTYISINSYMQCLYIYKFGFI